MSDSGSAIVDFDLQQAMKKANEEYYASRERFKKKRIEQQIESHQKWLHEQSLRVDKPKRGHFSNPSNLPDREILFDRQNGLCALCKLPLELKKGTIDHIIPKSKEGSSDISNKQLTHWLCNNVKGDSTDEHDYKFYQNIYLQRHTLLGSRHSRKMARKNIISELDKSYLNHQIINS